MLIPLHIHRKPLGPICKCTYRHQSTTSETHSAINTVVEYILIPFLYFKGALSGLSDLRQFWGTESHLEMKKNAFYFT